MHDDTVDRTTDGTGKVTELSFDEIRELDAGTWFSEEFTGTRVPTFREVLAEVPSHILCNCHLKNAPGVAEKATRVIADMGRLDQCFLAADVWQASAARRIEPQIRICNMSHQGPWDTVYPEYSIRSGAEFVQFVGRRDGLRPTVDLLHKHNIKINFYFGNTEKEIRQLIDAGVDYILTNDLDLCLAILEECGVEPAGGENP
jgi:glycerophosphoryl diester phosphodiesterase